MDAENNTGLQDFGLAIGCPPGLRVYDFAKHKIGSVRKLEAENNRLRQALLDAWGKAELGAKIVENPDVAGGFKAIAEHCAAALAEGS
jgi:hypothetical protein